MKNVGRKKLTAEVTCRECGLTFVISSQKDRSLRGVYNSRNGKVEFFIACHICDNSFVRVAKRKIPKSLSNYLAAGENSSSTLAY